jgi:hypothetical protein
VWTSGAPEAVEITGDNVDASGEKQTRLLRLARNPYVGEMALAVLAVDRANKFLYEDWVVRRIVMATACSAEITMPGDA